MSVSTEISRLTSLRNSIRTKLIALGILSSSTADLQDCYDGISAITGRSSSDLSSSGNTVTAPAGYYNSAASLSVGTAKAAATYNVSSSNQEIAAGTYLSGKQTIRAVTTSGISAANIKDGAVIKVGDSADDDRITAVTGTFTDSSTVSSGQTAAAAAQILSGYSAWVDGAEVQGSIGTIAGSTTITGSSTKTPSISKQAISISGVTDAAGGSATTTAPSSGVYVAVKSEKSTGTLTATPGVTTAGYGTSESHGITAATKTVGANASAVTYVPITTATPAFDGGTLSGGSTATGTNVTLSTTDNGMKVQTAYTAASTAVLYNGAVEGWVSKADNAQALAAQNKSSTNGTAYYVTGVTLPKSQSFSVTVYTGASTQTTFTFTTDANGNTTVAES